MHVSGDGGLRLANGPRGGAPAPSERLTRNFLVMRDPAVYVHTSHLAIISTARVLSVVGKPVQFTGYPRASRRQVFQTHQKGFRNCSSEPLPHAWRTYYGNSSERIMIQHVLLVGSHILFVFLLFFFFEWLRSKISHHDSDGITPPQTAKLTFPSDDDVTIPILSSGRPSYQCVCPFSSGLLRVASGADKPGDQRL
ncbi:hypothetical protein H4582DRAFT_1960879 [Lactarius indigo]|nr:hypothetical protein H4582DRAFT_1960879 [Lactarius indigo]